MINVKNLVLSTTSLSLLLLNLSCETIDSENIKTKGIYAEFEVKTDGTTKTEVSAILLAGGISSTSFVELSVGDELIATIEDESKELEVKSSFFDETTYSQTFSETTEDTLVTISFNRNQFESAPDSTVTIPSGFTITAPEEESTFNVSDGITFEWDNSGKEDYMELYFTGDCLDGGFFTLSQSIEKDEGNYTLESNFFKDVAESTCIVTAELKRMRLGFIDEVFENGEGGEIKAYFYQKIDFRVKP